MVNLIEILKNCPAGTKLYSPLFGEVTFRKIDKKGLFPIVVETSLGATATFSAEGRYYPVYGDSECLLFPSKDQRDWSKFKTKKTKFDPKTLKPYDKVLVFNYNDSCWICDFYSHKADEQNCFNPDFPYICIGDSSNRVIPYSEETKHLVGTTEEAPEYYRYWED